MFVRMMTHRNLSILPWYLAPDDGGGSGGGDGDGGDDGDQGDAGDSRKFSQDDVNRYTGRSRAEGEKAARKAMLESLGVKDEAEAKKLLEAQRKAAEKDRSELDTAKAKATEHETAARAARREAADAKLELQIDRALLAAEANPKRLARLSKLVKSELGDEPGEDDIKDVIAELKSEFAEQFTASKGDDAGDEEKGKRKTGPAPSGQARDGKGASKGAGASSALDRGRERARRHQGRTDTAKTA